MCEGPSGLVFQLALYALLRAANGVPQLRQRVRNDEVIEYDSLAVMTPVMTVGEGFRQVWCDNAPSSPPSAPRHAEDCRGKRDIPGAAHRRWRAFYLRQLSAMAPLHLDDPCGICRRRGGPRAHTGKLQNGVIPVAGRFNHAFVDGLHASRFYALVEEGFNDPERLWLPLTETAPSLLPQR